VLHNLVVAIFMLLMSAVGHLGVITGRKAQSSAKKALAAGEWLNTMQRAHHRNPGGQLIHVSTILFFVAGIVCFVLAIVH
jgi:hypothetical protein